MARSRIAPAVWLGLSVGLSAPAAWADTPPRSATGATITSVSSVGDADGEDPQQARARAQRIVSLLVGGTGLGAMGVATILSVAAAEAWSEADRRCPTDPCTDPHANDLRTSAEGAQAASIAFFVVGGAAAVLGTVLYFDRPDLLGVKGIGVSPRVSPVGASASLQVTF